MDKVITMVLFDRPEYTRAVVAALKRATGIQNYLILPRIEPGNEEVLEIARSIDFAETQISVNESRCGGGANTYAAWEAGFQRSDFIIHIEDDTVPAPDCLTFMEHCAEFYKDDQEIFSISSYNRHFCRPEDEYAISRRNGYTCWLVGLWKSRWDWARRDWSPEARRYASHLAARIVKAKFKEIYPLLSRSQNIGVENGIHEHSAAWHRVYHHTNYWAHSNFGSSAEYKEVHDPMITAVLVTGMNEERYSLAQIAIQCFKKQTHIHRELVIVNHGCQSLDRHDDARIKEIMVKPRADLTVGELRNRAFEVAIGDFMILWDDDDWHAPDRMAVQLAAWTKDSVVLLKRQVRYNLLNGCGFCVEVDEGLSNTMLFPLSHGFRFERLKKGEDAKFVKQFGKTVVVDNSPLLHIRTFHGDNLWDSRHTMQKYADVRLQNLLDFDAQAKRAVATVVSLYPQWTLETNNPHLEGKIYENKVFRLLNQDERNSRLGATD